MGTDLKFAFATLAVLALCVTAQAAEPRLKVALTFDDLPLNGTQPPGITISQITRDTLKVMKRLKLPPSYGFINAWKLEGNADAAEALKLWVASGNPLANHTYRHLSLSTNSADEFQLEIKRNEPVLELLMPAGGEHDWRWFRYPYLHEGDTLEKRRAIRAFLAANGYRIAQTTLDHEDYLWNSAWAACLAKPDAASFQWLRESYLAEAARWFRVERDLSRQVFGREINHVMLLHLGAFSSTILPDLVAWLTKEGYEIVTLEEAQSDPIYAMDPDVADANGGTLTDLFVQARKIPWPDMPDKPREKLREICK
jgi:peptidoglycan-N-acetylglucosamine deacetylase